MSKEVTSKRLRSTFSPEQAARMKELIDEKYAAMEYIEEHREELIQQYPDRWIAVESQQVKGDAASSEELHEMLRSQGCDFSHVLTWFVATGPRLVWHWH